MREYSEKTRCVQPRRGPLLAPDPTGALISDLQDCEKRISVFYKAPSFHILLEQPELTDRKVLGKIRRPAATEERTGLPFRERALAAFSINNGAGLEAHGNCLSVADTIPCAYQALNKSG